MNYYPHAKINLSLSITGKRPDGYHTLDTVFQPVTLCDCLKAEPAPEFSFSCSEPGLSDDRNLVCRAFRLLKEELGFEGGLSVYLEKHIPSEAGLGGGSADCAVMLRAANELLKLGLSEKQLRNYGARLGADVPAQLLDQASRGRGTGTELTPIDTVLSLPLLILKPSVPLSTPAMYRAFDERGAADAFPFSEEMQRALEMGDAEAVIRNLHNDFESVVREEEVLRAMTALKESGAAGVLLSGSGSAVFGIYRDPETRNKAEKDLKRTWRTFSCETLNREEMIGE